jgi:hypothetical protein
MWQHYIYGSFSVSHLFFHFGGGRPLHTVQSLIFRSLMDILTICFATSSSIVFLKILPNVVLLPRCGFCLLLCPLMLLSVVLSFLRCSCCLEPRFPIPVMPSGFAWHLFLNVYLFKVPLATLSLVCFYRCLCSTFSPVWLRPLCYATPAWRLIPLRMAANFFRDPPSP